MLAFVDCTTYSKKNHVGTKECDYIIGWLNKNLEVRKYIAKF